MGDDLPSWLITSYMQTISFARDMTSQRTGQSGRGARRRLFDPSVPVSGTTANTLKTPLTSGNTIVRTASSPKIRKTIHGSDTGFKRPAYRRCAGSNFLVSSSTGATALGDTPSILKTNGTVVEPSNESARPDRKTSICYVPDWTPQEVQAMNTLMTIIEEHNRRLRIQERMRHYCSMQEVDPFNGEPCPPFCSRCGECIEKDRHGRLILPVCSVLPPLIYCPYLFKQ